MATSMRHKTDRPSAAYLKKGMEFYGQKQYDRAERALFRAMDLCNCGFAVQKQPRIDDEILKGIAEKDLKGTLAKKSASCKRCDNPVHVDALDSLIATYEVQGRLDEGVQFAAKMINLSPREPKSYLRLGKILRLKNQQTLAYYTYKQGVELVKRKHPNHALLNKIKSQINTVLLSVTFDPMTILPVELINMIFKYLDFQTVCRCLRISKTWRAVLTGPALSDIWKVQQFRYTTLTPPGPRKMFPTFKAYAGYAAGGVTELSIDGCARFLEQCDLPRVLQYSRNLKFLKLREVTRASYTLKVLPENVNHLRLVEIYLGVGIRMTPTALRHLITPSHNSLEELSIFELPQPDASYTLSQTSPGLWYQGWPKLEHLKTVRLSTLEGILPFNQPFNHVNLLGLMELTPNIEEAWIDLFEYNPLTIRTHWSKLRRFFVGDCQVPSIVVSNGEEPCFDEDMRELHLEGRALSAHCCMNNAPVVITVPTTTLLILHTGPIAVPHLPRLEKLSLLFRTPLTQIEFESMVRPSLESGTLQELDLRPLPVNDFFQDRSAPTIPAWFKSEHITYMSLTGFTQYNFYDHTLLEAVVLAIVDGFPNLRIVDVGHELFLDTLLAKLIQRGVRTIYYRGGATTKDDLKEWAAKKHGARLVKGLPKHIPSLHPDRQPTAHHTYV
ncbi:uncharacterized protein F4822DRAFT_398161 [Hypoxylon trugodes]|uniref:uncharacterized protein n=1 Tax=Hypoxylon trugodes TaxID=326681 RepID=UPI00219B7ACA|nr:uncharacterized protein F4822DRAFT_398161 [Hypoxylon trugodes]KAI1389398.1 hypothetical protein F4822DRAFT_398161 [Hypoxylon trugodes]